MDFTLLINDNKRTDDYVNATKWCAAFGKQWKRFKELDATSQYTQALENKWSFKTSIVEGKGRATKTWVHPMLAIELARWLSPEFSVKVNEIFKRYLEGDATLATEVINRSSDRKAVDTHIKNSLLHAQYLESHHGLTDALAEHGAESKHFAQVHSHNNKLCSVEDGKRAEMDRNRKELMTILGLAEGMALRSKPTNNPQHAVNRCKKVGNETQQALAGVLQKYLA